MSYKELNNPFREFTYKYGNIVKPNNSDTSVIILDHLGQIDIVEQTTYKEYYIVLSGIVKNVLCIELCNDTTYSANILTSNKKLVYLYCSLPSKSKRWINEKYYKDYILN